MIGTEVVANRAARQRFDPSLAIAARLRRALLRAGLSTRVVNDVICLAPPLTTPEASLDRMVDAVGEAVQSVLPVAQSR